MGTNTLTLLDVLQAIYIQPRRLQSNFVRDNSQMVARLASCGLITTANLDGTFGVLWRTTFQGLRVLDIGDQE